MVVRTTFPIPLPEHLTGEGLSWPVKNGASENPFLSYGGLSEVDIEMYCGQALPEKIQKACFKRKAEYQMGRFVAKELLKKFPGVENESFVGMNPDGSPDWPKGFTGSITHTKGFVGAVVGKVDRIVGVGIDTEVILKTNVANRLQHKIADAEELESVSRFYSPAVATTLLFCIKEAFYKCFYPINKIFLNFEDVKILFIERNSLRCRVSKYSFDLQSELKKCQFEMGVGVDHIYALCFVPRVNG